MHPAVKVARIAGASRHSRLETEPTQQRKLPTSFGKVIGHQGRSLFLRPIRSYMHIYLSKAGQNHDLLKGGKGVVGTRGKANVSGPEGKGGMNFGGTFSQ